MLQQDILCLHTGRLTFTVFPSQYPGHFPFPWPLSGCVVHSSFVAVAADPGRESGVTGQVRTACESRVFPAPKSQSVPVCQAVRARPQPGCRGGARCVGSRGVSRADVLFRSSNSAVANAY